MSEEQLIKRSFGFSPSDQHHFCVVIDTEAGVVGFYERLGWKEGALEKLHRPDMRCKLRMPAWEAIRDEVRLSFNSRLRAEGLPAGKWADGANLVRVDLGKELVLLAWAIEEADPGMIDTAILNWKGFDPSERWWLYTQAAASVGDAVSGRGKGWRKALRYIFTYRGGGRRRTLPAFADD
jgi:hypothetical protein